MSNFLKTNFYLICIVVFAVLLRFINLDTLSVGFNQDEASQAYSAYSISQTGHDEWGNKYPLTSFISFLDYKAPLQTYLMLPFIKLFGLGIWQARLPSAVAGVLAVLAIYFLANLLFPKFNLNNSKLSAGHLAAFLLAISPWSLSFSRSAMEANLSPVLLFLGLIFYLKSFDKPNNLFLSFLFFGLCSYGYHSAKIFLPLFLPLVSIYYLFKTKETLNLVKSWLLLLVLLSPLLIGIFSGSARRGSELLLTNFSLKQLESIKDIQFLTPLPSIATRLFVNKYTFSVKLFLDHYLGYFNPSFWFITGSGSTSYSNLPDFGLVYPFLIIPIFAGLYYFFIKKPKFFGVILLWLLISPIPAALTKDGYHAHRAVLMMGLAEIFAAVGVCYLCQIFNKQTKAILIVFLLSSMVSLSSFFHQWTVVYPINNPYGMAQGWSDVSKYLQTVKPNYQQIYLPERLELQHLVAFYTQYPPLEFQKSSKIWWNDYQNHPNILYLDQLPDITLPPYHFVSFDKNQKLLSNSLYLFFTSGVLPDNRKTVKIFYNSKHEPWLEAFQANEK